MSHPKSNPNPPRSPSFNANSYASHSSGSGTSPRKTHRKRASALRLSSDTTSTLPEYISVPVRGAGAVGWQHHSHQQHQQGHLPYLHQHLHSYSGTRLGPGVEEEEDKPPDYPDSAEEADEDTDTDVTNTVYVPVASPSLRPQTASPRRAKRFLPGHKRRQSVSSLQQFQQQQQAREELEPSDPYLDSLLERSVNALEMSNTLLQSSISTQTSLSAILGADSPGDGALEARAVGLSSRIRDTWDVKAAWADDLEEITRNVEGLFIEGNNNNSPSSRRRYASRSNPAYSLAMEGRGGGISCSLPNSGGSLSSMRRRPSLDLRLESDSTAMPRLQYSQQNRSNLVSPPPRALTQYVASTQDAESILLPSTIGLRSPPSLHPTPDWRPLSDLASSSTTSLLSTQSFSSPAPSKLTDKPLEPSTPAYNMLSSFVYRPTPPGSATPSFMSRRRDSSIASGSTERERKSRSRRSSTSPVPHKSPDINRGVSPIRPMTPPAEESSSSSDGFVGKRTVQSLRKILDDQPPPPPPPSNRLKSPAFMPRTPAPVAEAGTSTATASISRLFTKGKHSSSTRAASPPRQSAMKQRHRAGASANGSTLHSPALSLSVSTSSTHTAPTPSPLPSPSPYASASGAGEGAGSGAPQTLSIPDLVSKVLKARNGLGLGSNSITDAESSGQSTPSKRISFAELPESYASTRPASSRFTKGNKSASRKRKHSSSTGSGKSGGAGEADEVSPSSWWSGWLGVGVGGGSGAGMHGLGVSLARNEERVEDRMTRNWGGRVNTGYGSGGLDDWAV